MALAQWCCDAFYLLSLSTSYMTTNALHLYLISTTHARRTTPSHSRNHHASGSISSTFIQGTRTCSWLIVPRTRSLPLTTYPAQTECLLFGGFVIYTLLTEGVKMGRYIASLEMGCTKKGGLFIVIFDEKGESYMEYGLPSWILFCT